MSSFDRNIGNFSTNMPVVVVVRTQPAENAKGDRDGGKSSGQGGEADGGAIMKDGMEEGGDHVGDDT